MHEHKKKLYQKIRNDGQSTIHMPASDDPSYILSKSNISMFQPIEPKSTAKTPQKRKHIPPPTPRQLGPVHHTNKNNIQIKQTTKTLKLDFIVNLANKTANAPLSTTLSNEPHLENRQTNDISQRRQPDSSDQQEHRECEITLSKNQKRNKRRSKEARQRRCQRDIDQRTQRVQEIRKDELSKRQIHDDAHGHILPRLPNQQPTSVVTKYGRQIRKRQQEPSTTSTMAEHYAEHGRQNKLLRVEFSTANITGHHQGAVKARVDIPFEDKRKLCPVVGRVDRHADPRSDRVFALPGGDVLDADYTPYDVGYLYYAEALWTKAKAPPNYAGYINSLTEQQRADGHKFNAAIEYDEDTDILWIVQTAAIRKDDEILVDYGTSFKLP